MWIAAIRFVVHTKDVRFAGTDSTVQCLIMRDGHQLQVLNLDHPSEDDLERGTTRNFDYRGATKMPRRNDQTEELPEGIGQDPMPYPPFGFEFSQGLEEQLTIRLRITGSDMWIKDKVELFVLFFQQQPTSFDTFEWREDAHWTHIGNWNQDVAMSTDSSEGVTTWDLVF